MRFEQKTIKRLSIICYTRPSITFRNCFWWLKKFSCHFSRDFTRISSSDPQEVLQEFEGTLLRKLQELLQESLLNFIVYCSKNSYKDCFPTLSGLFLLFFRNFSKHFFKNYSKGSLKNCTENYIKDSSWSSSEFMSTSKYFSENSDLPTKCPLFERHKTAVQVCWYYILR